MLLIAVLIRLDTPGPALFRQKRVGKDGKLFTILKFRSMFVEAPKYSMVRRENAMVTRIGCFLRRTSLDELPQLFNVIRGEMSLIGPRPEQPFLVEQYEPWQHRRHLVKPGITGWWQVNGRNELPMQENTEYDIYYVDNLSLLLDLKILLLTVREVMRRRGAY
jgi:lipopolysaccharide/colanic/teichoic acid biosynthesis glycosyltransferase